MELGPVTAEETRPLRRRVLYRHWPEADVHYPEDDLDGAFHLGVRDGDGALVAVASWYPQPAPHDGSSPAYRLRGMAVDPAWQGRGVGRQLFEAGRVEVHRRGGSVLWANARDVALDFYLGLGMAVVGDRFFAAGGLPHHLVVAKV